MTTKETIRVRKDKGEIYLSSSDLIKFLQHSKFDPKGLPGKTLAVVIKRIREWQEEAK